MEQDSAFTAPQIDGNLSSSSLARKVSSTPLDVSSSAAISLSDWMSSPAETGKLPCRVTKVRRILLFTYVVERGKKRVIEAPHRWLNTSFNDGKVICRIFLSFGGSPLCWKLTPKSAINHPSRPNVPERKNTVWGSFLRQMSLVLNASR